MTLHSRNWTIRIASCLGSGLTATGVFLLLARGVEASESYIPKENVEEFVVRQLDLASFRNSTGPRRELRQRTFKDLGLAATSIKKNAIEIDSPDWYFGIQIIRRADINRDGIEDLEVCFTDRAKTGSYHTSGPLLLTRYSSTGYLIALNFEVSGCPAFAR